MLKHILSLSLGLVSTAVFSDSTPQAIVPKKHEVFLEKYCLDCHDNETQKGKVNLETLAFNINTIQQGESWQKVLNAVNSLEMPPEKKKQPTEIEKSDFLDNLSETLVTARKILSDADGVSTIRRLSRREYENTLHDLLGIQISAEALPSDHSNESYDTIGSSLYMSSSQIDNYRKISLSAIKEAMKVATADHKLMTRRIDFEEFMNPGIKKQLGIQVDIQNRFSRWSSQVDKFSKLPQNTAKRNAAQAEIKGKNKWDFYYSWDKFTGAPSPKEFGFVDAYDALHWRSKWEWLMPHFLAYTYLPHRDKGVYITTDGNTYFKNRFHIHNHWLNGPYKIKLAVAKVGGRQLPPTRKELEPLTIPAPDASRCFLDIDSQKGNFTLKTFQVTGSIDKPNIIEFDVVKKPEKLFSFKLSERGDSEKRVRNLNHLSIKDVGVPNDPAIWIDYVEITGPHFSDSEKESYQRLQQWIQRVEINEAEVKPVILEFSKIAMRGRIPPAKFFEHLNSFYRSHRKAKLSPQDALAEIFSIILSSPGFLYLSEKPQDSNEISDLELANRLSYFLTAGPPDEQLLKAAISGQLKNKTTLLSHTRRLFNHPELIRFVKPFIEQWLGLDRLDFFQFNTDKHLDYTLGVKKSSREEIYETFTYWLKQKGSLINLLHSDTIVINALLADFYSIPGVQGDHFRPIKVPPTSPRGGLLGMAAISAMGSNGEDTSPVERGAWVLRKLMNNPPPPAPPNIPQLSRLENKVVSTKELVFLHQEKAQCAQCHRKIDPIGFGLENFNAVGKWRTMDDRKGVPPTKRMIDPTGKIHAGAEFKNFLELRNIISSTYQNNFAHSFTENLAAYALGRHIGFTDQNWVEALVAKAKKQNYPLATIIEELITSDVFRKKL